MNTKYYAAWYVRGTKQGIWRWQRRAVGSWVFWPSELGKSIPHILKKEVVEGYRVNGATGVTQKSRHYIYERDFNNEVLLLNLKKEEIQILN